MTDLELFDSRGKFVMPSEEQINALDADTRGRWQAVRNAAFEHDAAKVELKTAETRVVDLMTEVGEVETYIRDRFPGQTREQALREFLATERAKRGF